MAVLREGRPARAFTDDLMEGATWDRARRRDLQAREEGDTDHRGGTHPFGWGADEYWYDGEEPPVNTDAREENEARMRGEAPHEPRLYVFDPRPWTDRALSLALMEYHSGLVNLLGDRTGPHAKTLTTWLRFGTALFAEIGNGWKEADEHHQADPGRRRARGPGDDRGAHDPRHRREGAVGPHLLRACAMGVPEGRTPAGCRGARPAAPQARAGHGPGRPRGRPHRPGASDPGPRAGLGRPPHRQAVTVLGRDESAVEAFRSRHPGAKEPEVSLGEFLRATILGPRTDAERRALSEGTDSAGGYAVPDRLFPQILDAVRAKAVTTQAGARVVNMESDSLRVAKITADPTPAWRDELGAVAESDPAFGATDLVAKSLAVVTRVSREVMADAMGLEQAVVTALAGAFAAEIDGVVLEGTGVDPEPKGLKTQTGLTEHDASSNPLDWALLLAFQQALFAANADALSTLIVNPRDWANLFGQTGTDGHYIAPPAPLAKVGVLNTTGIDATTTSVAYGGAWEEVLIGIRESFNVQILRERYADTGEIDLLCHARVDVGMGRAAKMGRIINLSAP